MEKRTYHKFVWDMGFVSIAQFLLLGRGIFLLPIITRSLGVETYGIWSQLSVTISLLSPVAFLGLPATLVRFLPSEKKREEIQEILYSALAVIILSSFLIGVLLFIFQSPIASFFETSTLIIQLLALIVITHSLNAGLMGALRGLGKAGLYSSINVVHAFGEILLVFLAIILGFQLIGMVVALLLIRVFVVAVLLIFFVKTIGIRFPNFTRIRSLLSFGLPTVASNLLYWVITSSDRYLIAFFLGTLFVGYYSPAYTIANLMIIFIYPFSMILPATLPRYFDVGDKQKVQTHLMYSLKYFLLVSFPVMFLVSVTARELLRVFSTAEIAERGDVLIPILMFSVFLYGVQTIFAQTLILFKKTSQVAALVGMAAAINVLLNLIFIPTHGIVAAAFTTLIAYLVFSLTTAYLSQRRLPFVIDMKSIAKITFSSIVIAVIALSVSPRGFIQLATVFFAGGIVYIFLLYLLGTFQQKEIDFWKKLIMRHEKNNMTTI